MIKKNNQLSPSLFVYFATLLMVVIFVLFVRDSLIKKYVDGVYIYEEISKQLQLGPRFVGSIGHQRVQEFITKQLTNQADEVITQKWIDQSSGRQLTNIIARYNPEIQERMVVATHYDTDEFASKDNQNSGSPVPGANDGASGTALLLYLIQQNSNELKSKPLGLDIVFLDAENFQPGDFSNWNTKGSEYFVKNLSEYYQQIPLRAVFIDMVCKQNIQFKKELASQKSAPWLYERLWAIGSGVDKTSFSNQSTGEIKDDHTNFIMAGIPSVLLIDMDYRHHNTTQDTLDKCSYKSLDTTYKTIKKFLIEYDGN